MSEANTNAFLELVFAWQDHVTAAHRDKVGVMCHAYVKPGAERYSVNLARTHIECRVPGCKWKKGVTA